MVILLQLCVCRVGKLDDKEQVPACRDVNGQDNFRTEFVAESVLKNPYPVPKNLADKDIRFRTKHPDMVQDMVCTIASEYELSEF